MSTRLVQRTPNLGLRIRLQPLAEMPETPAACVPEIAGAGWWNAETEAFDLAEVTGRVQAVELTCEGAGGPCHLIDDLGFPVEEMTINLAPSESFSQTFATSRGDEVEFLALWKALGEDGRYIFGSGAFFDGPTITADSWTVTVEATAAPEGVCMPGVLTLYAQHAGGSCLPLAVYIQAGA